MKLLCYWPRCGILDVDAPVFELKALFTPCHVQLSNFGCPSCNFCVTEMTTTWVHIVLPLTASSDAPNLWLVPPGVFTIRFRPFQLLRSQSIVRHFNRNWRAGLLDSWEQKTFPIWISTITLLELPLTVVTSKQISETAVIKSLRRFFL